MMTLYTVIGLYGRLDGYFVFYCTWDIWKAFPFQPDGFMLFLELNSDFWDFWTLSTNTVLGTGVESMTFGSVAGVGDVDCLMT